MRAKAETLSRRLSTGRAGNPQRLAKDEVENDTDGVGDEDSEKRPEAMVHAAALSVSMDVRDQEHEDGQRERSQSRHQDLAPVRPRSRLGLLREHEEKDDRGQSKVECGGKPSPEGRDDGELVPEATHENLLSSR
jgi:hypothetical protein